MIGGGHPSLLVTLDGMAGAGKTTTVRLLGPHLRNMGYRVHTTAEPTSDMLVKKWSIYSVCRKR